MWGGFGGRLLSQEHTPITVRVPGGSRTRRYGVHSAACHTGTLPAPSVSGRSGSRTRKAVSGLHRFPGGSRRQSGGPSSKRSKVEGQRTKDDVLLFWFVLCPLYFVLFSESSRVDSNHRSSPCRGVVLAAERRDDAVPRPGIEPGTPRSKRGMMSVSPPGQERKVRDSNPQGMFQPSRLATEFLSRSDTFRSYQWTHRDSNPDRRHAIPASSHWTMGPSNQWTAGDSNPDSRRAEPVSCRIGRAALISDPAWTRTQAGFQPESPGPADSEAFSEAVPATATIGTPVQSAAGLARAIEAITASNLPAEVQLAAIRALTREAAGSPAR